MRIIVHFRDGLGLKHFHAFDYQWTQESVFIIEMEDGTAYHIPATSILYIVFEREETE